VLNIAVIADTHNRLPASVVEAVRAADEIWHLGDVCEPDTLDPLLALGCPLHVVRGNNDDNPQWKTTLRLERRGRVFHLEHIPWRDAPPGVDVMLHGHTHVAREDEIDGVRHLNPGCITRPNRGAPASFAWLTLGNETPRARIGWRVVLLSELV
jgi:putative phosphoesterase